MIFMMRCAESSLAAAVLSNPVVFVRSAENLKYVPSAGKQSRTGSTHNLQKITPVHQNFSSGAIVINFLSQNLGFVNLKIILIYSLYKLGGLMLEPEDG